MSESTPVSEFSFGRMAPEVVRLSRLFFLRDLLERQQIEYFARAYRRGPIEIIDLHS